MTRSVFFWFVVSFFVPVLGDALGARRRFVKRPTAIAEAAGDAHAVHLARAASGAGGFGARLASLCIPYLCFCLAVQFVIMGVRYSADSYSYYDMSRFLFRDFGLVSTVRQYVVYTDYGISFPYLYPLLIAFTDNLTGLGMFSGVLINLFAAWASLYLMRGVSLKLARSPAPGFLAAAVLFFNPHYLDEIFSARAVPLSVLCALLMLFAVAGKRALSGQDAFLVGLFAGAGLAIRFDFIVIVGLTGLILVFASCRNSVRTAHRATNPGGAAGWRQSPALPPLLYLLGLLVFTTPWILYSIARFQHPWISDNGGTLFLVQALNPQRFYLPDEAVPSLLTHARAWFVARANTASDVGAAWFAVMTRPMELCLLLGSAGLAVLCAFSAFVREGQGAEDSRLSQNADDSRSRSGRHAAGDGLIAHSRFLFVCVLLIYFCKTLAILLVGYPDLRYHAESVALIALTLLCLLRRGLRRPRLWLAFTSAVFLLSAVIYVQPALQQILPVLFAPILPPATAGVDPEAEEIGRILDEHSGAADRRDIRLFFLDGHSFKIGAFTGVKCYGHITNINEDRLLYLLDRYIKPGYLYATEAQNHWLDLLRESYRITRITEDYPLYSIANLSFAQGP